MYTTPHVHARPHEGKSICLPMEQAQFTMCTIKEIFTHESEEFHCISKQIQGINVHESRIF